MRKLFKTLSLDGGLRQLVYAGNYCLGLFYSEAVSCWHNHLLFRVNRPLPTWNSVYLVLLLVHFTFALELIVFFYSFTLCCKQISLQTHYPFV